MAQAVGMSADGAKLDEHNPKSPRTRLCEVSTPNHNFDAEYRAPTYPVVGYVGPSGQGPRVFTEYTAHWPGSPPKQTLCGPRCNLAA